LEASCDGAYNDWILPLAEIGDIGETVAAAPMEAGGGVMTDDGLSEIVPSKILALWFTD